MKKAIMYHGYWGGVESGDDVPDIPYEKLEVLKNCGFEAHCDIIDYDYEWSLDRCKSLFRRELEKCKSADVIVGFSLGGYTAFKLAGYLSKDLVLINPAIDRSITRLHIKEYDVPKRMNFKEVEVYLGEMDDLIDMNVTLRYLKKEGIKNKSWIVNHMAHRTSPWQFSRIAKNSIILNS